MGKVIRSLATVQAPAGYQENSPTPRACGRRQQAIQRIFEKLPEIGEVTILPRRDAPADNQRYFIVEYEGAPPTKRQLIEALGRRAMFYKVLPVRPVSLDAKSGKIH